MGQLPKINTENEELFKGQLNSEWIYEVIVSPKISTKNYRDFCPGSLLEGRAEIFVIFGWDFGRNLIVDCFEGLAISQQIIEDN